jgi:hypothetical protein
LVKVATVLAVILHLQRAEAVVVLAVLLELGVIILVFLVVVHMAAAEHLED